MRDYEGLNVIHEANPRIIKDLKAKGVVLRHEQYRHSYPHCWRTDEPLIYKAVNSWYLKVTAFRDRMVELNQGIDWVPSHIRDGLFGNWLANARDWNISRDRFWGAPIPVWVSDDPKYPRVDVYGSLDELEHDFGVRPLDLHRPMIDELTRPNPDDPTGKSMMRRVPEVLDCWFESGSMPFAQLHYPFENKERFDANFPGDFIVEYVAQTRGWFYTLMVLSTALFDRAPFKNCICHGVVLGDDHQKMSKRLKNYPDPTEVFESFGADALRWYMLSSPVMSGGDIAVARADIGKSMRQAILPIWNAYYFFTLYANIDGVKAKPRTDQKGVLDRYILAKTREMIAAVQDRLDHYDLPGAYAAVPPFIEALNNWYIRRSRQRFWAEGLGPDKQDAFDTLFTALTLSCRTLAPLLPFVTERIFTALTGEKSVHLADWPDIGELPQEGKLVQQMDLAREVSSATLTLREARRLRVRLPLRKLTVAHPEAAILAPFKDIIAEEVNVKDVVLSAEPAAHGARELKVNPKIGAKIGAKIKEVLPAAKEGRWSELEDGRVEIAGIVLDTVRFRDAPRHGRGRGRGAHRARPGPRRARRQHRSAAPGRGKGARLRAARPERPQGRGPLGHRPHRAHGQARRPARRRRQAPRRLCDGRDLERRARSYVRAERPPHRGRDRRDEARLRAREGGVSSAPRRPTSPFQVPSGRGSRSRPAFGCLGRRIPCL